MKIILAALNAKYVHSNLAVYNLEAYAKEQFEQDSFWRMKYDGAGTVSADRKGKPEIVVKEYTINHNLDLILQSLYQERATVAAFSCYIWNIYEILTIAKELHKVVPGIHIWLGGPEVSYDSLKLLEANTFVEGIMQGEGEATFYDLVKVWDKAEHKYDYCSENMTNGEGRKEDKKSIDMYQSVPGIAYRDINNHIHQNPPRQRMPMDRVPFIYQDLSRFQHKILYYETSRGCPFSCSYCLSSIEKQVRFRSMELVEKELQFFLDNRVSQVKLIDRTFNCNREHSLAIWRYILEHDNGVTNFHFEVAADLIGEEELEVFRRMRPGLIQLEIGLQSTNPQTIQEIRRVTDIEKLKWAMFNIHCIGNIHQHLDLIAGLPYEDFVTFKKSFNEAYAMKPNQLQLGFLKVLKGSYMEEQVNQYELKYQDFQPYEVLSTKWISYDEIIDLKKVEEMVEVYYNSDQFEHVLSYLVPFFDSAYAFYEALGRYYADRGLFGIGFKREARYKVLRGFCKEWIDKCDDFSIGILDDLLLYDYYLRENAKSRPSWAANNPVEKTVYHTFFKSGGSDEIFLCGEGYDSRVASRMMHIEPISVKTAVWLLEQDSDIMGDRTMNSRDGKMYCLFDYEHRNSLSKGARVRILSHL